MSITINATAIPAPQTFEIETFDIVRQSRTASGKMVVDAIAKKKKFKFNYTALTGVELNAILDLLHADYFLTLGYPTETGTETVTVSRGDVPRKLLINDGDKLYQDISFELVEQ